MIRQYLAIAANSPKVRELRRRMWHGRFKLKTAVKRLIPSSSSTQLPRTARTPYGDAASLQQAWNEMAERRARLRSAAQTEKYRNIFARGFFYGPSTIRSENLVPEHWRTQPLGDNVLSWDPNLRVSVLQQDEVWLCLLGHAFDSQADTTDPGQVAQVLFEQLVASRDAKTLDEVILWLGGRFVVFAFDGEETRVHVDAMASKSCFWGQDQDTIVLASHSALVANALGDSSSKRMKWALNHPDYSNPSGKWLPGTITPHDRARLIHANCVLSITGSATHHLRVFPTKSTRMAPTLTAVEAAETVLHELRFQSQAWIQTANHSYLALTAGSDSRSLLLAGLDLFKNAGTVALTYHFFERNAEHSYRDLLGANRTAELAGLQHKLVDIQPFDGGSDFARMYKQSFPSWARFPTLAKSFYEQVEHDSVVLFGIGGEIGTVFYRDRPHETPTAEELARKFTSSDFHQDPELVEEMGRYMEYTHLKPELLDDFDFYDLFYWESRMSGWAAAGYSEYEAGPLVGLPFNTRRIFVAMLSLSYSERLHKALYKQIEQWATGV